MEFHVCSHFKLGKEKINYFREIVSELNKNAIEANIKIDRLLASYHKEQNRSVKPFGAAVSNKHYHSKWFAFQSMPFLKDKFKPR